MEFRQLKTFYTICKFNNFTKTASELGYAQSTVTMQIKALEDELNTVLFERLGKNITLTESGEKLMGYAVDIMKIEKEIYLNVNDNGDDIKGTLNIGVAETLCFERIPKILKEFQKKYPKVKIQLVFGSCATFPKMLYNNEIDLAYSFGTKIDNDEDICYLENEEKMCFLASPNYKLKNKGEITYEDIMYEPLLLARKGCANRAQLENDLEKHNIVPNILLETDSKAVLKQFAINGLGIAFTSLMAAKEEINRGELINLNWKGNPIRVYSQLLFHKDKCINSAMKGFLEIAENQMEMEKNE